MSAAHAEPGGTRGYAVTLPLIGVVAVIAVAVLLLANPAAHADESPAAPTTSASTPAQSTPDTDQKQEKDASTSSDGGDSENGNRDEWIVALASALGGAMLTLLGERAWGAHLERKALKSLLAYVAREVDTIRVTSESRRDRPQDGAFNFDEPIGTSAWELACSSDVGWRLVSRTELFNALTPLYDKVARANHQREVAIEMFNLSQNSRDDKAGFYLSEAIKLLHAPYEDLEKKARKAKEALGRKRWSQ